MPPGRPPRYDWEDKRDICFKLYVKEKRSIPQIIKYFVESFNIPPSELPSEKSLARQFRKKWAFPRRKPEIAEDTEKYIGERMSALWAKNVQIHEIRKILEGEGHVLSNYDFQKMKSKYGISRRGRTAFVPLPSKNRTTGAADESEEPGNETVDEMDEASANENGAREDRQLVELTPEEAARRAQHWADVHTEREQERQARKRRRRTRGYDHLPPDAPGLELRYGSETSLDECKAFLGLDNDLYTTIRKQYDAICADMNVDRKKSALEDGRWQESKDRLVRENMHLSAVMHPLQPDQENKAIALDLICADVCKRIRVARTQLTIADANNILGINPHDSKTIRRAFYEILQADHYTTRLACGNEHWNELRQQWYAGSPLLQAIVAEAEPAKMKCVDMLCRDAGKRYNDDMGRQDPSRKRQYQGPGPGAAKHNGHRRKPRTTSEFLSALPDDVVPESSPSTPQPAVVSAPPASTTPASTRRVAFTERLAEPPNFAGPIDPALAVTDYYAAPPPTFGLPASDHTRTRAQGPVPAYFRLAAQSQLTGVHPCMWLGKLTSASIPALHAAATSKSGAATVKKVYGIIKNEDGTEDQYQIDGDDELAVYLETATEKATFVVWLEGGYA